MFKKTRIITGLLITSLLAFSAVSAFALTPAKTPAPQVHAIAGTVSAISGTTITLKSANNGPTYTVDASKSSILQGKAVGKLSNIKIGDTIIVRGTINGTKMTASSITAGVHLQPEVVGTISSISGNTITVFANNITYAVDASKARIMGAGKNIKVSDLAAGDNLIILGTVNGTNISATSIFKNANTGNIQGANFIGTVKDTIGNSFTFQPRETNSTLQTVNTSTSTVFMKNGAAAAVSDLASGQTVVITGAQDPKTPNTISANKVEIVVSNIPGNPQNNNAPGNSASAKPGFFGKIWNWIKNIF